jgi:protein-S-isoprenylcysteine O-methyltransferase Ste14
MKFDWRALHQDHPRLFTSAVVLKRLRTKVGLIAALICVAKAIWLHERPFELVGFSYWVIAGLVLVFAGLGFRLAAFGCIRKKEQLATDGVYSLCRHPLYLGSMLMTFGFCCLLGRWSNFVVALVYFAVFYPLTMVWEEFRLAERYPEVHQPYCERTPLLLPMGRFRPDAFRWGLALRNGGGLLFGLTLLLLAGVEVMAKILHN